LLDKLLAIGVVTLGDLAEVGTEPLVSELDMDETLAARLVEVSAAESKRIAAETEAAKRAQRAEAEAAAAAEKAAQQQIEAGGDGVLTPPERVAPESEGGEGASESLAADRDVAELADEGDGIAKDADEAPNSEATMDSDEPAIGASRVELTDPT
jgi:hypothetical protein